MSRWAPASSAKARNRVAIRWLLACLSGLCAPLPSHAQSVLLFKGGAGPQTSARRAELEAAIGPLASPMPDAEAGPVLARARGVDPSRLAALRALEGLLGQAQAQAGALAEQEALATLAEAARLGEQLGDVPGAAPWNAEVQLRIGITAAQAGLNALANEAFARAATLDPGRQLLAAEAPPAVVELYQQAKRRVATAASGTLEVRVGAPRAEVYLDDVAQGRAPATVRAPVGRHLLRIEADGHRAYGSFIDVFEGARAPVAIAPSPDPEHSAARALEQAAQAGDYAALADAARSLERAGGQLGAVWVVELARRGPRALLVRCDAGGCFGPVRLAGAASPATLPNAALSGDRLARDRGWLDERPTRARDSDLTAWWERWYVWGGAALVLGGAALAVALASEPTGERQLQVVLESEALRLP